MRRWQRASIRALVRQPTQLLLAIVGIALGVAVVVAVQLANSSADRAFALSVEGITGDASHQLTGPPAGLDEAVYKELRIERGLRASAPVIEGFARHDDDTLRVLGVDPLAGTGAATALLAVDGDDLEELLTRDDTALLAAPTAERLDIAVGDRITLEVAGREHAVRIIGVMEARGQPAAALEGLMVIDLAAAQAWFDRAGRLDRIELDLDDAAADALRADLPAGITLERIDARAAETRGMTAAFRTNLVAMALLAVVIGIFLIYNTMTFAVVRRRPLIATLRGLGVTRGMIFAQIVAETLILGALATALGLAGGIALAHGLIGLVTRTINDLYFVLTVSEIFISPLVLVQGAAIGLLASLLGALGPALEAAGSPPAAAGRRSVLEQRSHRLAGPLAGVGALLLVVAALLLALPGQGLVPGFIALAALVLGAAALMPGALLLLTPPLATIAGRVFGALGRMAARGSAAGLSRTGLAIIALAIALSATVSVGMMITSFRASVETWLDRTLAADIYLSAPQRVAERHSAPLPDDTAQLVDRIDGIAAYSRGWRIEVDAASGRTLLLALDPAPASTGALALTVGDRAAALAAWEAGDAVLITEPLATHRDLGPGAAITLRTDAGPREFPIAGVYRDYNTDRGVVLMHRDLYDHWWDDDRISSLGLYLQDTADVGTITQELRAVLAATDPVRITPSAEIREQSLVVFDRTFAITGVLRWLAIGVAFVGVVTALLALELERARERAILRATGATPGQVGSLILLQNGMLGAMAGLFSLPLGYALAQILIHVINRRGFGWSMDTVVPGTVFAEALIVAIAAALLAGLWPAWRAARAEPAATLREE